MAHDEPPHQELDCLQISWVFLSLKKVYICRRIVIKKLKNGAYRCHTVPSDLKLLPKKLQQCRNEDFVLGKLKVYLITAIVYYHLGKTFWIIDFVKENCKVIKFESVFVLRQENLQGN